MDDMDCVSVSPGVSSTVRAVWAIQALTAIKVSRM